MKELISFDNSEGLNPEQFEAASYINGPLLILAGAGTGKTKVLTTRIFNIIDRNIVPAYNILAVTFTNKAAKEMQERVNNMIDATGLNIGTFHSISAKILRSHVSFLDNGIGSNFTIIDQDDQLKVIKLISSAKNIDIKTYLPKSLHIIISRWKDQGLLPNQVGTGDVKTTAQRMAHLVYHDYQKHLQNSNAVDFGDLLLYCNQLFIDHPEILAYYQNKFRYILIDEYQDTNAVQYLWARMLASKHQNICCVGDDDQSIYGWRGAEVQNILRFEQEFPSAKVVKLERNYRSSSCILQAATGIIQCNKYRHDKKLWTEQNAGEKIKVVTCFNDKEEARFITNEVATAIKTKRRSANQIAILVRAGFQTRAFEENFISSALPYQIIGGLRFYERKEIRDLLSYIRLSVNNNDNMAFERIINVPKRSIGDVTIAKIRSYADEQKLSYLAAIKLMLDESKLSGKIAEELTKFLNLINAAKANYDSMPPAHATKLLFEESSYMSSLREEKTEDSKARLENIGEMLRAIEEFNNIHEFIEHSSLVMDNEGLESDFGGAVKLMTLHASKGLEFDLVFLPGWEEGMFPHQRSINEEGDTGLEEERRIAYVGITRAKKELYITHAENRRLFAEIIHSVPSRFLADLPKEVVVYSNASSKNPAYFNKSHKFSSSVVEKKAEFKSGFFQNKEDNNKIPGKKVTHQQFGNGVIIRKNGTSLEIAFEKVGVKTINQDYITLV